jgi:hypothetical protein
MRGSTAERINSMPNEAITTETAATVAEQGAPVAPTKAASKKGASPKKGAPKAKKTARPAAKPSKRAAKSEDTPRGESKGAKILDLIGRPKGATLAEIMKATDWQAHSVRGFLSTTGKKRGVKIESEKNDAGERVYQIKK